jgi:hypothetical protein
MPLSERTILFPIYSEPTPAEVDMYALEIIRDGTIIGQVRFNPLADHLDSDVGVPACVMSDIVVTYYRDNVLFGESGDGYMWAEVTGRDPEPKGIDCPSIPGRDSQRHRGIPPSRR